MVMNIPVVYTNCVGVFVFVCVCGCAYCLFPTTVLYCLTFHVQYNVCDIHTIYLLYTHV